MASCAFALARFVSMSTDSRALVAGLGTQSLPALLQVAQLAVDMQSGHGYCPNHG